MGREKSPGSPDKLAARAVVPAAASLSVVYAFLAACHPLSRWLFGEPYSPPQAALLAAVTSVGFGLAWVLLRRAPVRSERAHPTLFAFGTAMVANATAYLFWVPQPIQTSNMIILALAAGLLLLSRPWLFAVLGLNAAGWSLAAAAAAPDPAWFHWGAMLGLACLLAATVHEVRLRGVFRLVALRELAERRRAEANRALARAEEELIRRESAEQEVRDRDQRLAEAQRRESLGVMAGGVAHDFNNLLTVLLGHAELAMLSSRDPEVRASLGEILSAGELAAHLSRQMLAYSGRAPIEPRVLSLEGLLREPLRLIEVSLAKTTALEVRVAPDTPSVEVDPTATAQIVVNLVQNAADALPGQRGTVTIDIRSENLDDAEIARLQFPEQAGPGRYACIEVRDSGCGMDEATRKRMFDPFFTTKASGTGLGLAAALGLSHAQNGGFEVESEPGVGTTVRLFLPASDAILVSATDAEAEGVASGCLRVLVVDDEPAVRRVARKLLQHAGYEVVDADGCRSARAIDPATLRDFDVALVDLSMPDGNGAELADELAIRAPHLAILVMSGFDRSEALSRLDTERFGFIGKPFHGRDVVEALSREVARMGKRVPTDRLASTPRRSGKGPGGSGSTL